MTEKKKETEAAMDELDFEDEDTEHETASAPQKDCCCCKKTKERSEQEYKDLIHRLNRIEGQIRGIRGMVERDAYCTDILTQVSAVSAALNSFNKVLLANHIKTCVMRDIKEGKEETVDELVATLQKLMK
jgi:DNA-binding FrmR family transcriptional regulator